jgi:hypothetical protein
MNCPYCRKFIHGFTGLQEAQALRKHLNRCRKNPANAVLSDGQRTVMTPKNHSLIDALEVRKDSGQ